MLASKGHRLGDVVLFNNPHDERYERAVEYTLIVKALLTGAEPVTHAGRYFRVENLRMIPSLPPDLAPGILTSRARRRPPHAPRRAISATRREVPATAGRKRPSRKSTDRGPAGIRVGITSRGRRLMGLGRRAPAVPGGPQGTDHPQARDAGVGLRSGTSSSPASAPIRSPTRTSTAPYPSRTTKPSARTSWGATTGSARNSPIICRSASARSSSTCQCRPRTLSTRQPRSSTPPA